MNTATMKRRKAIPAAPAASLRLVDLSVTHAVPLADLSDENLFARYQAGDEGAFEEIVDRYEPLIKGFLHKRL